MARDGRGYGWTGSEWVPIKLDANGKMVIDQALGGGSGDAWTEGISLRFIVPDSFAAPTDDPTFAIALLQDDIVAAPSETAQLAFPAGNFDDVVLAPSEARALSIRSWATGCTTNEDNTGHTVAPANANGQPDGVFANCRTGTGTENVPPTTTDPVTVTTGSLNYPGGLSLTGARVRMFFRLGSILAAVADNIFIRATSSGGYSQIAWQGPALATLLYPGEDYSTSGLTFDVSGLTSAQLSNLQLQASYDAGVVLLPQSGLEIDAWCLEVDASL